jgi:hypothetical protein
MPRFWLRWKRTEPLGKGKGETSGKESVTFTSSRPLFGKKDLKGTLSHHSSPLRGTRVCFSYRLGFLSITWWERGRLGRVGVR